MRIVQGHRLGCAGLLVCVLIGAACDSSDSDNEWERVDLQTHIRSFDGELNPTDGPVHVDVYVLDLDRRKGIRDSESEPQGQNTIELTSRKGLQRFNWPMRHFAGGWCEIVDLDGDGAREFVFIDGSSARVVSYQAGAFQFRESKDALTAKQPIRLLDFDRDGRLDFVTWAPATIIEPSTTRAAVALANWERQRGFDR